MSMIRAAARCFSLAASLAAASLVAGCAPSHKYTDGEVASIPKLGDLMWAQAQASDPAFKLRDNTSLTDEQYAVAARAGERIKLTAPRIKDPSLMPKGDEYNRFADQLAGNADALLAAVSAKDVGKTTAALSEMKNTCRGCHHKFR